MYRGDGLNLYVNVSLIERKEDKAAAQAYADANNYAGNAEKITGYTPFVETGFGIHADVTDKIAKGWKKDHNGAWHDEKGHYAPDPTKPQSEDGHYLHRPYLRQGTVDGIIDGRGPNGTYIRPDGSVITGQVDIGHQPGHEFWRCRDAAESLGWSQPDFNDFMNNSRYYKFEDHEINISHKDENKSKEIKEIVNEMIEYKNNQ